VKHDERVPFKKKIGIFFFVPSCVRDFPGVFCFSYLAQSLSNAYTSLEGEELRKYLLAVEVLGSKWAEGALLVT
jgi:hypothetical protein